MSNSTVKQNKIFKNKQGSYTHLVYSDIGRFAGYISASYLKKMKAQVHFANSCEGEL